MPDHAHTNRLIHASSPYLLQHAHNPVDWYEWGDEAFEKARREDKLVLVSIGYSACHWCHVMERESFEMEDTAEIMNKHFVCIKVDREERPDVDQVYMEAVQLLTGSGGWPLNCFTLPDGRPVHGGTYYRKADWERTLASLANFYETRKEEALEFAADLTAGIRKLDLIPQQEEKELLPAEDLADMLASWRTMFDLQRGGYNYAPKFPMPNNWELFLQHAHFTKDADMLNAVNITLTKMAEGGIYDQVGGGFARYSVDAFWKAPHFEKMLYDNAQLMSLYSSAWQKTKNPLYKKVVYHTHRFLAAELTSPQGGFYSALDADSEGVEGKFYIWTHAELKTLLGEDEHLFSLYYSVDVYGNWEHGSNILYKSRSDRELEQLTGKPIAEIEATVERCASVLLEARAARVRPGLDDKVITCWNALMIKGYADAFIAFHEDAFLSAALHCAEFTWKTMWQEDKLLRVYRNGKASINAFAEDYATLCEAFIRLYEACADETWLLRARKIMDVALVLFHDGPGELFYFRSKDDAPLIARKTDFTDDVIPSANSVFAKCLHALGLMFDEQPYSDLALEMVTVIRPRLENHPNGYSNWMQLIQWMHRGFTQLVITGAQADEIFAETGEHYLPGTIRVRLTRPSEIPLLSDKPAHEDTAIYVCRDRTCGLPQQSIQPALEQLID